MIHQALATELILVSGINYLLMEFVDKVWNISLDLSFHNSFQF